MSLLLAKNHKQVINQVWEKYKHDSLRLANGSAEARYKIIDADYDKLAVSLSSGRNSFENDKKGDPYWSVWDRNATPKL